MKHLQNFFQIKNNNKSGEKMYKQKIYPPPTQCKIFKNNKKRNTKKRVAKKRR